MSREAAVAFLAAVAADSQLRAELDAHLESTTDAVGSFVDFAARRGHSFAPADLAAALVEEAEISEEHLDRVAGGINPQPEPPRVFLKHVRTRYGGLLGPALSSRGIIIDN